MSDSDTRNESDRKPTTSRRNLLRVGTTAVATGVVPGIVSANDGQPTNSERADRVHQQALSVRDRTGSQRRFKQFLSKRADYFANKRMSFTPASFEADAPSTQNWSSDAISTDLTLTYYYDSCTSGDPYAYFDFYITVDSEYGRGEGGPDQHSIGWADHHFRYEQDSAYHDSDMSNLSLEKEALNGVDWSWKDGKSCGLGTCGTKDYYVGCKAQLLTTDQERGVEASYWDMWKDAKVESVSFTSSGSVSFTFTQEGRTDQYGYQIREDSDAYSGCW
ncbi:hypothetical protein [Halorussus lipolyticus]|uniref:hypothetical protein n=1 Tax=Halorussus lipolyticus TaxID=3034024 RepID=UPI0023E78465|nr:hypothetical protein [Halorussus sp. DT80]